MKKTNIILLCIFLLASCAKNINTIPDYIPYAEIPSDYTLGNAKSDGLVVHEDYDITDGQSVWDEFVKKTADGDACAVRLMFYYTLEGQGITPEHEQYEEIKDNYPGYYIQDLSFDGKIYKLYWVEEETEYTREYKHLKRFEETSTGNAAYSKRILYVLVNDNEVTWEQIFRGMISSQSDAWIAHNVVYSDYIYE